MMITERIQALIHKIEVEAGARWLNYVTLMVAVAALAVWYDLHCYHNFDSPEAMDAAQVARNVSEGKGFTTECIRPFSIYLLQKHNRAKTADPMAGAKAADYAQLSGQHPDLANAPLYPLVLAGLFKLDSPEWKVETHKPFWSDGQHFVRYKPEFAIAIFNQMLLMAAVVLTFMVARIILDTPAAWLSAILMLFSNELWKSSVSGLPVQLLLLIFLGLVWCLASFEVLNRNEQPEDRRRFALAVAAGLLVGLGTLTRYSFGWVIVPLVLYFTLFGGVRKLGLAVVAFLVFAAMVLPWMARNYLVSGTAFGTAGYALLENSAAFPGSRLMQSLNPEMFGALRGIVRLILVKLTYGLPNLLRGDLLQLGGGWVGILFWAGLLLGLRNLIARRVRYFTMMCLGVFVLVAALGQTPMTTQAQGLNAENPLVLLTPLAVIFGVAFFLTLLNQMELPSLPMRYIVIGLLIVLVRLQFMLTLLPPQTKVSAYPPYYPQDIQRFSAWMEPNELVMSDVPWAVAWYGDRQCTWTTLNCEYEFVALNDFIKPVNALYLTLNTLDGRFFTECLQGGVDNWSNFGFKAQVYNHLPNKFPLSQFPLDSLGSGLFLCDHKRW